MLAIWHTWAASRHFFPPKWHINLIFCQRRCQRSRNANGNRKISDCESCRVSNAKPIITLHSMEHFNIFAVVFVVAFRLVCVCSIFFLLLCDVQGVPRAIIIPEVPEVFFCSSPFDILLLYQNHAKIHMMNAIFELLSKKSIASEVDSNKILVATSHLVFNHPVYV